VVGGTRASVDRGNDGGGLFYPKRVRNARMNRSSELLIPTERTHGWYLIQTFGTTTIIVPVLSYLWLFLLAPKIGIWIAALVWLGFVGSSALWDVWTWTTYRPVAIGVSSAGIAIHRTFRPVVEILREDVLLRTRAPAGFGVLSTPRGGLDGFILTPNQFTAARRFFPVDEPRGPLKSPD
jgi:hypothetical protein